MIHKDIFEYIEVFSSESPAYLKELERETYLKTVLPQMISGEYQGRLLSFISHMLKPKQVLEIGTFTGYSSLCLAEGLHDHGQIHTIDINEELKAIQDTYFQKSGYRHNIIQYTGNALEIIPEMNIEFDLIFLDADKKNYPLYFDLVFPKLKKGGILMADNVLWYGKVPNPEVNDPETLALRKYNQLLVENPSMEVLILPVRDGISIARKK